MEEIIIDSDLTLEDFLAQKSEMQVPQKILDRQRLVDVEYYSFDLKLHKGQIVVDKDLVDDIKSAFNLIRKNKFPVQSVIPIGDLRFMSDDEKSVYANNSSGFNYRFIAKTDKLSNHAYGRAIDLNPYINPYIRDDYKFPPDVDYDPSVPGVITAGGPIVQFFKQRGWEWGGEWIDRKDYQHFEKPHIA